MSKYDELLSIFNEAEKIYESSISWKAKYDLIFSAEISRKVKFEWYDPDASYQEDVTAFMNAFYEYMTPDKDTF